MMENARPTNVHRVTFSNSSSILDHFFSGVAGHHPISYVTSHMLS